MTSPIEQSDQQDNTDTGAEAGTGGGEDSGASDTGFPPDTALVDMTTDQQLAYYKHQNRQAENKLKAFKGVTPKQVTQMVSKISELEQAGLTADEKALKEAVEKAAAEATAAVTAQWAPKYQLAGITALAAPILDDDQLKGWLDGIDPSKFVTEDGEVDKDKVMTNLTAMFGRGQRQQAAPVRQWGQYSPPTSGEQPGSAGAAEAKRRFGKT
jgi:hypothetical protein